MDLAQAGAQDLPDAGIGALARRGGADPGVAPVDQAARAARADDRRRQRHGRDAGGAAARARSPGAHAVHGPIRSEMRGGAQERFAVAITNGTSAPLATLLERAGGPPGADASLMA